MHAKDVLRYGQRTVLNSLKQLPDFCWEMPGASGYWSIKDIIAHLTSFELVLVELLDSLRNPDRSTPTLEKYINSPNFNDEEVNKRKSRTIEEVLDEFNGTHARVIELMENFPQDQLRKAGILPLYGMEYDLEDFLVYTYYGHKREHTAQIDAFYDRIKKNQE